MAEIQTIERAGSQPTVATLYCFPHAGGAAGEYARWAAHTPGLRIAAVQPPGRAHKLGERAFGSIPELVAAIVGQVRFTPPFALFGHSLGALVAYEVARNLDRAPVRLFISSCPPPPLPPQPRPLHLLTDAGLHAEIERRWGPLPAAVAADERLLHAALACYRADLRALETYRHTPAAPLRCPITVLTGDREPRSPMEGWRAHTAREVELRSRPGDHFHIREDPAGLGRLLSATVRADVNRTEQRASR
ncbi:surfactin synthase thioesterase subunit [Nocardia tenerifensis]|uniref:Thioesterase TesA n=1 Tax=Nocardia tenerifensis TaxID=228006 RepID=A0A318JNW8_9NOCA|nr:alpha/beta fold hydrolase [Nocardia tenerifensis]PXX56294.1 surfactin synthase thioesterase subunit [Nocardia tenerifensis]